VVSVAKQYQNQGLGLPDLINEGNLGLIKAAQRFDETKGFKFISYAVWWIRQSILQAIAEQSRLVRLPLNQIGTLNKVRKSFSKLEQDFQREPSAEELAQVLNFSTNHINDVMRVSARPVSFDAPLDSSEDSSTLLDILDGNDSVNTDTVMMQESMTEDINRYLSVLSPKEIQIVKMFFGIGHTHNMSLDEISIKVQLTRERVRQIKEGALRKLKSNRSNKFLKSYL
jgi:RNA polymerase primary sigma factor